MYHRVNFLRFYFAVSVAIYHVYASWVPQAGTLAVLGFFFVSGFLISKLLTETYRNRPKQFLVNRFLRIYPAYLASVAIGSVVIILLPESTLQGTNPGLRLPGDIKEVLENIVIFGLQGNLSRIVPPAWSLDIELSWYIIFFLLSFFSVKLRKWTLLLFASLVLLYIFPEKHKFYGDTIGSGYAFCAGALHYYIRPRFNQLLCSIVAFSLVPAMYVLPHILGTKSGMNDQSLNWLVLIGFVVLLFISFQFFLYEEGKERADSRSPYQLVSQFLGNLSYPFFLTHWHASAIFFFFFDYRKDTIQNTIGTLLLTLAISVFVVYFVEKPVQTLRKRVRETQ